MPEMCTLAQEVARFTSELHIKIPRTEPIVSSHFTVHLKVRPDMLSRSSSNLPRSARTLPVRALIQYQSFLLFLQNSFTKLTINKHSCSAKSTSRPLTTHFRSRGSFSTASHRTRNDTEGFCCVFFLYYFLTTVVYPSSSHRLPFCIHHSPFLYLSYSFHFACI